jgi:hypothetical protein
MFNVAAFEAALALDVVRTVWPLPCQCVLVGKQAFQANGASSMELAVADFRLGDQAITEAVRLNGHAWVSGRATAGMGDK